jgi:large subunit ribosomal protein L10
MPSRVNTMLVAEYQGRMGANPDFVAADTTGLSMAEFSELRRAAREKDVRILVVKTSLACLALKDAAQPEALAKVVAGPTALFFGGDGLPTVARVVSDFAKKSGKLAVRGGIFEKQSLTPADVARFRDIPDRPTLLSQILSAVVAPLTESLGLIQSLLSAPAALTDALARKKAAEGET